jgi:hypothetical protein
MRPASPTKYALRKSTAGRRRRTCSRAEARRIAVAIDEVAPARARDRSPRRTVGYGVGLRQPWRAAGVVGSTSGQAWSLPAASPPNNMSSWLPLCVASLHPETLRVMVGDATRELWSAKGGNAVSATEASTKLVFNPPEPGPWEQDPVHFPRPLTRYFQETHPAPFKQGTNEFARFYGMLIDGLQMSYVNGFGYNQVLPAPEAEIPQRFRRAEEVYTQKLWREQLRDWDENCIGSCKRSIRMFSPTPTSSPI